jgi:hypothetical protein
VDRQRSELDTQADHLAPVIRQRTNVVVAVHGHSVRDCSAESGRRRG